MSRINKSEIVRLMLSRIRWFHWILTWNGRNKRVIETKNSALQITDTIDTQIQSNKIGKIVDFFSIHFSMVDTANSILFSPLFNCSDSFTRLLFLSVCVCFFDAYVLRWLFTVNYCHLHLFTIYLNAFQNCVAQCNVNDDNINNSGWKEISYKSHKYNYGIVYNILLGFWLWESFIANLIQRHTHKIHKAHIIQPKSRYGSNAFPCTWIVCWQPTNPHICKW